MPTSFTVTNEAMFHSCYSIVLYLKDAVKVEFRIAPNRHPRLITIELQSRYESPEVAGETRTLNSPVERVSIEFGKSHMFPCLANNLLKSDFVRQ